MKLESLVLELFADTSRLDREVKNAVDRAASQIKKLEQGNLSVKVNEKSLHNLNRLLDVKQAHIKQTANVFKNTPIKVVVDAREASKSLKEIARLKKEIGNIHGKLTVSHLYNDKSTSKESSQSSVVSEIKKGISQTKRVEDAIIESSKNTAGAVLKGNLMASGAQSVFGSMGKGVKFVVDEMIAERFGSADLLGRKITESLVKGLSSELGLIGEELELVADKMGLTPLVKKLKKGLNDIGESLSESIDELLGDDRILERGKRAKSKSQQRDNLVEEGREGALIVAREKYKQKQSAKSSYEVLQKQKESLQKNADIATAFLENIDFSLVSDEDMPQYQSDIAMAEKTLETFSEEMALLEDNIKKAEHLLKKKNQEIKRAFSDLKKVTPKGVNPVYFEAASAIFGEVDESRLPNIARMDKGSTGEGTYSPLHNEIRLRGDLFDQFQSGEYDEGLMRVLLHELRHAKQSGMGSFEGFRQSLNSQGQLISNMAVPESIDEARAMEEFLKPYIDMGANQYTLDEEVDAELTARRELSQIKTSKGKKENRRNAIAAFGMGGNKIADKLGQNLIQGKIAKIEQMQAIMESLDMESSQLYASLLQYKKLFESYSINIEQLKDVAAKIVIGESDVDASMLAELIANKVDKFGDGLASFELAEEELIKGIKKQKVRKSAIESYESGISNLTKKLDAAFGVGDTKEMRLIRKQAKAGLNALQNDISIDVEDKSVLAEQYKAIAKQAKIDRSLAVKTTDVTTKDIITNPIESLQLVVDKSTDRVVEVFTQVGDAIADAGERIKDTIEAIKDHPLESLQLAGNQSVVWANKGIRTIAPAISGAYGVASGLENAALSILPYGHLAKKGIQIGAVTMGLPMAAATIPALAPVAGMLGAAGHLGGAAAGSFAAGQLGGIASIPVVGGQVAALLGGAASGLGTIVAEMGAAAIAVNAVSVGAKSIVGQVLEPQTKQQLKSLQPAQEEIKKATARKTSKLIEKAQNIESYLPTLPENERKLIGEYLPKAASIEEARELFPEIKALKPAEFKELDPALQSTIKSNWESQYKAAQKILFEFMAKMRSSIDPLDRTKGDIGSLSSAFRAQVKRLEKQGQQFGFDVKKHKMDESAFKGVTLDADAVEMPDISRLKRDASDSMQEVTKGYEKGAESELQAIEVTGEKIAEAQQTGYDKKMKIESPSKWAIERMNFIAMGLQVGTINQLPKIKDMGEMTAEEYQKAFESVQVFPTIPDPWSEPITSLVSSYPNTRLPQTQLIGDYPDTRLPQTKLVGEYPNTAISVRPKIILPPLPDFMQNERIEHFLGVLQRDVNDNLAEVNLQGIDDNIKAIIESINQNLTIANQSLEDLGYEKMQELIDNHQRAVDAIVKAQDSILADDSLSSEDRMSEFERLQSELESTLSQIDSQIDSVLARSDNESTGKGLFSGLRQQFPVIDQAINKVNDLKDTIVSFGTGAAKLLVFAFLGKQLIDLGVEAVNVYRRFEGIFIASKMVGNGAKYLEKVREQTKALGGDLESTMRSAIQFSTALVGTNLESTGQQLFLDSDKALKSLGLQTQEYDNAMRAIIQISSKGKVSMEELSGQLGEQVPGALQIAADAMQTNVRGLIQMVSSGNLLAEEFVPKFVQQLKNRTAFLAPAVEQSLNASLGRLGAQKEDLFINIGAELSPAIIPLVNGLSTALKGVVDNFDAILFSAKALGLYLVSPAIIGGLKLIANNAVMLFTSLIAWMGKVQITAKTMWAVLAGPFKLVGILGATAGIEALIYVMQGGAKTFKSANEELSTFVESLGKVSVTPKNKNFFENQKEILYNFYLRPFDEQVALEELETLTGNLNNSIPLTTGNLDTSGIDAYVNKASDLQSQIDQIRAQKDVLMMEDPVKNKDAISVLEDQLYGVSGLITKTQKELNELFAPGGRAGIEEQVRIIESVIQNIKITPSIKDNDFIPELQAKLAQLRASLGLFDTAQEKVFNSLNRQRKAWIELTSAVAGYEYELTKAITKAETKLYQYFNNNNIGTETQSYLIAEFDVARQEAEVNKLEQFLKARTQYLGKNLTVDSIALVKEITGKSIIEIDVEGINKIEKFIQNNDSIKTIITEQVLDQLQAIAQDSQALEQARLELEKGKNSLRQAKITEEDYRINLSRSIFDFNKDLEVQLLGIQNQFRDYNRQLEDAAINSAKMVRGLIESYQDLNFDLEQNILTVQNEILDAQERLKLTNLKIQSESIDPGQDTIAKRAGSIILRLFESINSGESEKRRRLQDANQAQKEYTDTLRRIRDFEEQVMQERINQKRQIEDLTNGFKNLNQAVKDLVEQLNRSRDDLIRNTKNQSGRDISGQLQGVPSVAEMGQVNAVNPMAVNPVYTYQQSQRYPYAFDPEPEQVIRVAPQPRSNDSDFIRYGYGATPKYPDRAPDFYHSPAPRGYNPFSDIPMAPKKSSYIERNNQPTGAEREFLIRLTAAEARGEGLLGQVLFARSVGNRQDVNNPRAYLAKSNSLLDIMTAKNQYQAVRSGAINQNFSPKVIQTATQAVSLMDNVDWIKSELRKQGYKESEIKKLVNATGMRTPSAFNDSSQQYNQVRYKGHIFNSDKNAKDKLQSNLNFGITGFENVKGEYAQASGVIDWLGDVYGIGQKPKLPTTPMYPTWKGNPYPQHILQNPSGIYSPKNPATPQPKPATPTPVAPSPTTNIPPLPKPVDKPAFKFDKQFNFSDHRPQLIPLPQIKAVPDLKAPNFDSIIKSIPNFNTQTLISKTIEVKALKDAFTAINLANIDADKKLASLTAISEMAQLVMTTADGIRQMDFNLVSSADTVNRMTQESKGYLRTVEEINNVALDTARSYDNEINSRRESALQLRREVGSSSQQLAILKQQLNSRTDIDAVTKSTLLSEIDSLDRLIQQKNTQASILETEAQRLAKNRDIAIYNKLAREEQQRQLALIEELSSAQLALSNAQFERGGSLFNVGVITAARAEAEKLNANAKEFAEKNNGFLDPKRIQEYVKGQKELGEINIAQSYLDAIPALRDFSSGLKDIILMTSTWQEVTKKLVDTFAALVLDSLVIKPMQNWLAQGIAGIMGWTGDATAPIKFSKPKAPIEENFGNVLIDTTTNLGLFNSNLESSNSIIPDFITGLLGTLGNANDDKVFEFGSIINHVFGFAKGSNNIPNYASGIDSALNKERLESGKDPYLAVLHRGEAVLSTLNGDAQLLRNLKANGQWEHLKANREIDNYAYGTEVIVNRPNRQTRETNQTTIYKPEYKIYTQNADSFRKSQRQIEQETMARMRRAKR